MDVPSIVASTSDGGVPWFVSLAAEPLLLLQELHPGLNISALPPPPVPISLRSRSSLQKRACSNGSNSSNGNGSNSNNNNNNNNSNNSNNNSNSNSKSGGTNLVGPVVGAVVGTLALAVLAFLIYRAVQRRKARAAAVANGTGNPPTNVNVHPTPFTGNPNPPFTPSPMKETGSFLGPGGTPVTPNAYQVNMSVANSAGAPSTYSGSDNMSYYNAGGQNPGNAYFNQMPNPMPPQMPTAMPQHPPYNGPAQSPWNVNMGLPPVHPGQSPSPGISYPSSTPAPTFESSGISSTSSPPPMSPGMTGSNYAPWANPSAQVGSSSNTQIPMAGFMTAQQEKAQYSGAHPVSEKSQFSGVSAPVAASTYSGGSGSGKTEGDAPKPAPASSSPQQRNNATNEEEDAVPAGLPPPAYTFAAQ